MKADIDFKTLKNEVAQCKIDFKNIVVSLDNPDAADRINEQVQRQLLIYQDEGYCSVEKHDIKGGTDVMFNEQGLLTVRTTTSYTSGTATVPHKTVAVMVFDLRTGAPVILREAIELDGLRTISQVCETELGTQPGVNVADVCFRAPLMDGYEEPNYGVEDAGLRIFPRLPKTATSPAALEGVLVPWRKLQPHVKNDLFLTLTF